MIDSFHGVKMTDQPSEVDENIIEFDLVHNLLRPT